MNFRIFRALVVACIGTSVVLSQTTTLQFVALADNTLYEDPSGLLSNGAGQYLFVGQTSSGAVRRALVAFDTSAIPAGSRVTDVQLRLTSTQSIAAGPMQTTLHRVEANWGEGASVAGGGEGGGGLALPGDATWTHAILPGAAWTNLGGDFEAVPSSTTTMPVTGTFTFEKTVELIADVQD
ncbi:MAG: DNRLRE domain-containing protein, partial [Planctomycetota bacterium]|nr:DNRLRE domain-containing protein [Planctomycetota bacterium]